jgi:hypothetical protein
MCVPPSPPERCSLTWTVWWDGAHVIGQSVNRKKRARITGLSKENVAHEENHIPNWEIRAYLVLAAILQRRAS